MLIIEKNITYFEILEVKDDRTKYLHTVLDDRYFLFHVIITRYYKVFSASKKSWSTYIKGETAILRVTGHVFGIIGNKYLFESTNRRGVLKTAS